VCAQCQGVFTDPPTIEGFDVDEGDMLCCKYESNITLEMCRIL